MEIIVSKRSGNVLVYIPELKKRISLDSSTFGRHIKAFCKLNKKEFLNLPLNNN